MNPHDRPIGSHCDVFASGYHETMRIIIEFFNSSRIGLIRQGTVCPGPTSPSRTVDRNFQRVRPRFARWRDQLSAPACELVGLSAGATAWRSAADLAGRLERRRHPGADRDRSDCRCGAKDRFAGGRPECGTLVAGHSLGGNRRFADCRVGRIALRRSGVSQLGILWRSRFSVVGVAARPFRRDR